MREINSKTNPLIQKIRKLNTSKNIKRYNLVKIEGRNLIKEEYEKGNIITILATSKETLSNYPNVEDQILINEDIAQTLKSVKTSNGIIGLVEVPEWTFQNSFTRIIVLDQINNPSNLGVIARNAIAFNYDAIVLKGDCCYPYLDKAIRSSQGAVLNIPIIEWNFKVNLSKYHFYKFVLDTKSTKLDNVDIRHPKIALLFGNEANGITKETLEMFKGDNVFISINKIAIDSLSVVASSTIAMYELRNKNNNGK